MSEERQPGKVAGEAARPTGKRQLSGASTTSTSAIEAKAASRKVANEDENPGGSVATFFPEVVSEMRKVIWPTPKQLAIYTGIVFIFLILMTALVAGIDFLVGLGVEKVLGA